MIPAPLRALPSGIADAATKPGWMFLFVFVAARVRTPGIAQAGPPALRNWLWRSILRKDSPPRQQAASRLSLQEKSLRAYDLFNCSLGAFVCRCRRANSLLKRGVAALSSINRFQPGGHFHHVERPRTLRHRVPRSPCLPIIIVGRNREEGA